MMRRMDLLLLFFRGFVLLVAAPLPPRLAVLFLWPPDRRKDAIVRLVVTRHSFVSVSASASTSASRCVGFIHKFGFVLLVAAPRLAVLFLCTAAFSAKSRLCSCVAGPGLDFFRTRQPRSATGRRRGSPQWTRFVRNIHDATCRRISGLKTLPGHSGHSGAPEVASSCQSATKASPAII